MESRKMVLMNLLAGQHNFNYIYCNSLVAQLVKNLPPLQETLVRFLGWEDLLEKG